MKNVREAMRLSLARSMAMLVIVAMLLAACGTEAVPSPTSVPAMPTNTTAAMPTNTTAAMPTNTTAAAPTNTTAAAPTNTTAAAATNTTAPAAATNTTGTVAGGPTNTAAPPAPTITPLPPVAQPPGSTRITFWYGLTGANGNIVREVVNRFNSSQQQYYVDAIQQPNYDDTINKLNASLAGGDLPNVVQIYDIGTRRMIDSGRIRPVQEFVDRDGLDDMLEDMEPAVRRYYTVGGTLYSMPFNSSAPVLYYDKNAFREVGLDPENPPETYSEVIEAARKLVKKDASGNLVRSGLDFTLYGWIFEQQLAKQDVTYVEPDNGRTERGSELVFNRPEGENYLNFLKQLQDEGLSRNLGRHSGTTAGTTLGANFSRGDAAMAMESIAVLRGWINQARNSGGKVDVGVGFLPKPDNAPGGVIIGGASLWITDQGTPEQQEAAWQFVKFTAQPEVQAYFAASTGYYPIVQSAYEVEEMKTALQNYPQFQVAIDQLRATEESPATAGAVFGTFAGTRPTVEGAMEQFMLGSAATAKAALDAAANDANDKLEEYNSTVEE